jgi:hypothetical protein
VSGVQLSTVAWVFCMFVLHLHRNGEEKPTAHVANRRKSIRDVLKAGLSRMGLSSPDGEHGAEHHDLTKMDSGSQRYRVAAFSSWLIAPLSLVILQACWRRVV